jgi:hypothetical protein
MRAAGTVRCDRLRPRRRSDDQTVVDRFLSGRPVGCQIVVCDASYFAKYVATDFHCRFVTAVIAR